MDIKSTGPRERGSLVFGTLAGVSLSFMSSSFITPFSQIRAWSDGYKFIAVIVFGAIAGAVMALLNEWHRIPLPITFNESCVLLIMAGLIWFLLPTIG